MDLRGARRPDGARSANNAWAAVDNSHVDPRPKVVAVDADRAILRLLAEGLGRDYELAFAYDAVSALRVARRERPDLVLLDYRLPGGDGAIVVDRMRSIGDLAFVPIVLMSSWEARWSWEQLLELQIAAFVPKPFTVAEIETEISGALSTVGVRR